MPPQISSLHLWLWPRGHLEGAVIESPVSTAQGPWEYNGKLSNTDFITTRAGARAFDLNEEGHLEFTDSNRRVEAQSYTHAYWLIWKPGPTTWRTLFRHTPYHHCLIAPQSNSGGIGIWRSPIGYNAFKDDDNSHFTVQDDGNLAQERWRLYIVTARNEQSFLYVGDEMEAMEYKGHALGNCGTPRSNANAFWRLGHGNQTPGFVALAAAWSSVLTVQEMEELRAHPPNDPIFEQAQFTSVT